MNKSKLGQISEHVYWFSPDDATDRPTLGAVVGNEATLLVDAGNSTTHAQLFLDALAEKGVPHPKYLVLTHWHWDHVFGTAAFDSLIIASQETTQIVANMVTQDWRDAALDKRVEDGVEIEFCRDMIKKELPDRSGLKLHSAEVAFAQQLDIDLGSIRCQLHHVGGDHASDSTIVHIPEEKIMFVSDAMYPDLYHGPWNYTMHKLVPLLDKLLRFDVDHYLLGHHEEPLSRAEMLDYANMLKTIGQKVAMLGDDRPRVLTELEAEFARPLDEDDLETVDAFLAGLKFT